MPGPKRKASEKGLTEMAEPPLRIGSFNLQKLGQTQSLVSNDVSEILAEILKRYDLLLVMEPRMGTTETNIDRVIKRLNTVDRESPFDFEESEAICSLHGVQEHYCFFYRIKRLSVLAVRCFGDEPFCMTGWKKGPSRSSSATSSVKSASFESERIRRVTVDVLNKGGPSQLSSQTRQDSRNGQNSSFLVPTSDDEPGPNWARAGTPPAERYKGKDTNSMTEQVNKNACAPGCLCGNEARTAGTDNLGSGPSTVTHISIGERPDTAESNFRKKSQYKRKVSPKTDWVTHEIGIKKSVSCVNLADSISRQNDMFRRLSTARRSSSSSDSDDEKPDTADATVLDANDSKNEWKENEIELKKSVSFVDLTESGFHSCYMFQYLPDLQEESSSCEDLAQGSGPKDSGSGATPDEKRLQAEGEESAQPANRFSVLPVDETVPHNLNCVAEENNSHPPPERPGLRDAGGELLDALTIQVDDLRIGVNSCNGSRGEETRCPVVEESRSWLPCTVAWKRQKKGTPQKHPESASTCTWGAARDGNEPEGDGESHEEVIVATIFGPPPSPPARTCQTRGGDSKTVFADPILFSFSELPLSCHQAQGTRSADTVRSEKRQKGSADQAGWAGDKNQQNNPTPDDEDDDDDDDGDGDGDGDDIDDGGEDDEDKEEDEEVEEEEVDDEDSGDRVVETDFNETQKSKSDGQKAAAVSPKKRKAAKSIHFNKRASVMLTPNRFQSLSIAETKAKRKKRMCCCYVPVRNKYQKEFHANLKEAAEIKTKQNTAGNMQDPTQEINQNAQTKVLGKYQPNIPSTSYGRKATCRGPLTTGREPHVSAASEWQKQDCFTSIAPASSGSSLRQAKLHDHDDVSEVDDVGSNVDDVSLTSTDDVDGFLHRERFTGENFNAKRKLCERRGTFQRAGTADNSKTKQPRQRQHSAEDIRTERLDGQNICTEVRVSPSDCQSFVSAYMDDQNSQEQTENTSARPQKTYPVASEAGRCAKGQDTQTKDEEHAWCGDSFVLHGAAGEGGTGVGICQKTPAAATKEGGTESGGDDTEKDKGKGICQKTPTAATKEGGTESGGDDTEKDKGKGICQKTPTAATKEGGTESGGDDTEKDKGKGICQKTPTAATKEGGTESGGDDTEKDKGKGICQKTPTAATKEGGTESGGDDTEKDKGKGICQKTPTAATKEGGTESGGDGTEKDKGKGICQKTPTAATKEGGTESGGDGTEKDKGKGICQKTPTAATKEGGTESEGDDTEKDKGKGICQKTPTAATKEGGTESGGDGTEKDKGKGICQKTPTAATKEGGTESGGDDTEKDKGKGICQKTPTAATKGRGTDADVTDAQTEAGAEAAGKKHVTAGEPGDRETRRVDAETEDGETRHAQEENRVTGSQAWGALTAKQQLTGPGNNSTCSDDDREDNHADTERNRDGENGASCAQHYDAKETDFCTEEPTSEATETDTRQRAAEDRAKSRDGSASIRKPGSEISHTHAKHWCAEDCHTLTESRDAEDSTYTKVLGPGQSRAYAKNENAENDKQYTENQNPIDASAMTEEQSTRKAVNTSEIHGTESGNRNKLTESQGAEAGKRNELTETRAAEISKRNELTESQGAEAGKRNECTGNQSTEVEDKRNLRENEERVLKKKTFCAARNIVAELNEEHHGTLTEKTMYSGNQNTWDKEQHSMLTEKTMYLGNQNTWDKEQHSMLTEKTMYLGNQNTWDKEQHSMLTEKTMYLGNQNTWDKEQHSTLTAKTMYSGNQNTWDKEQHSTLTAKTMYSGNQNTWDKEQHSTLTAKTMYSGNQNTWDKEQHNTLTEKTMYSGNQDTWDKEQHSTLTEKTMYSGNQNTWDKEQHSTLTEKTMYSGNQDTWDKEQHSTLTEKTMYSGNQDTWDKERHSTLTEKTMYSGNQDTWDKERHSTLTEKTMYSGNQDTWDKERHSTLTEKTMYSGNQNTWDKERHSTLTEKTMYSGNQNANADVERPSSTRSSASWNRSKKGRSPTREDERSSLKQVFYREPFAVHFLSPSTETSQFAVAAIHTDPSDARREMSAVQRIYDVLKNKWHVEDVVMMGDFVMEESEKGTRYWRGVEIKSDRRFTQLGSATPGERSTFSSRERNYDRFVIIGRKLNKAFITSCVGFYKFEKALKLSPAKAAQLSDHYPIEIQIAGNVTTRWQKHVKARAGVLIEQVQPVSSTSELQKLGKMASDGTRKSAGFLLAVFYDGPKRKKGEVRATRRDVTDVIQSLQDFQQAHPDILRDPTISVAASYVSSHWLTSSPVYGLKYESKGKYDVIVTVSLHEPYLCHVHILRSLSDGFVGEDKEIVRE